MNPLIICAALLAAIGSAGAQHSQDHDTAETIWVRTIKIKGPVLHRPGTTSQSKTSILHFWAPPATASKRQPMTAPATVPITMRRMRPALPPDWWPEGMPSE